MNIDEPKQVRLPEKNNACESCYEEVKNRRRYSTREPSVRTCECGSTIYEIHKSCLDCAEKNNKCPWCSKSPWIKLSAKVEDMQ